MSLNHSNLIKLNYFKKNYWFKNQVIAITHAYNMCDFDCLIGDLVA
jgi:hypothetical protein